MALKRKPGCKVWIYATKVNGKSWERSTGESDRRRAELKITELKRLAQLHREQPRDLLDLDQAILKEVARIENDVSAEQASRAESAMMNFRKWAGKLLLDKVTSQLLEDYQRMRLKVAARTTVDKELTFLIRMLRSNGIPVDKPRPKRGRATEIRAFTKPEIKKFFGACPDELKPLFTLMLVTGARPAELIPSPRSSHVALLKDEVDLDRKQITIRSAKLQPGQKPKSRVIGLPTEVCDMLDAWMKQVPGKHLLTTQATLARDFQNILKQAGIERVDSLERKLIAHSFRHTYATMMAEAVGHNPFIVKQVLGHAQITTTDRYCHPTTPAIVIDLADLLGESKNETQWGRTVGKVDSEGIKEAM